MSKRMLGNTYRFLKGLNNLKALRIETLLISGEKLSKAVITTIKSNTFQGSLRYVFFDKIKP